MTDLHNEQDLEALYGPSTKVAEHQRGDSIQYTDSGTVQTGVILWVCAPGQVVEGRPPLGVRYIVENENKSWPDTVFPSDIVIDEAATDETLTRCKYCNQLHLVSHVERCPMKPHQEV